MKIRPGVMLLIIALATILHFLAEIHAEYCDIVYRHEYDMESGKTTVWGDTPKRRFFLRSLLWAIVHATLFAAMSAAYLLLAVF